MIKDRILLIIVIIAASVQPLFAQWQEKFKTYGEYNYKGLPYGLFTPAKYDASKSYPIVIYLHGANDTKSYNNVFYQDETQSKDPLFVLTPKCMVSNLGWGSTWTEEHTPAMEKTLSLLDSLMGKYNIDKKRLYIEGISMGGFGVFSVLAKEQGKFAAGFAICGGSDEKAAAQLLKTPLWIFHGSDDDVVPVHLSRNVYNEIRRLGGKVTKYTEYPGVKHNSWENASREKDLVPWLLSQKLK